jgi:hypothetical protein
MTDKERDRRAMLVDLMMKNGSPLPRDDIREALDVAMEGVEQAMLKLFEHTSISKNPGPSFMMALRELMGVAPAMLVELSGGRVQPGMFVDLNLDGTRKDLN